MVPIVTSPFALFALLAVPALIAIYFLHRRFRTREVSSLYLWEAVRQPAFGGRTRDRLRLPLLFWLELLAIVLLALAAAGPLIPRWSRKRPLVVVLDDSLSMRATSGGTSAHDRARQFVEKEIAAGRHDPVRIVFAGPTPQLASSLDGWTCAAPSADLDAAIAFAAEAAGPTSLILIATDHPPARALERGRVRWQSFGAAEPNLAFAAAARSGDRALFEVVSDSSSSRATTLTVNAGARTLHRTRVDVPARGRSRVHLALPPGTDAIEARLGGDAATFDDTAVLLPDEKPPVRVQVAIADETLRSQVGEALQATTRAAVSDIRPELVIADRAMPGWTFEIIRGEGAAFIGPFVVDRSHPLTEGVALDGLVWGAPRGAMPGQPVVLVGDQPLLTDELQPDGTHHVRMRFDPRLSNLQRSPSWPALLWNALDLRRSELPGLRETNITLGANALLTPPREVAEVVVQSPSRTSRRIPTRAAALAIPATEPGLWTIEAGATRYRFAANALASDESNLSAATTGGWGGWSESALAAGGYESASWILLLLALAALVAHQRAIGAPASQPARSRS